MEDGLWGKVIVITGGAGGIGSGKAFCEAGARVAVVDQSETGIQDTITETRKHVPNAELKSFDAAASSMCLRLTHSTVEKKWEPTTHERRFENSQEVRRSGHDHLLGARA